MAEGKKPAYRWVYSPTSVPKAKVPESLKAEVTERAQVLIEEWRPIYIKEPPKSDLLNSMVDLYTKWRGSSFYFVAKYACSEPNAISPSFESNFTRMDYVGNGRFNLYYMRHTGKWWPVDTGLPLDAALDAIRKNGCYHP